VRPLHAVTQVALRCLTCPGTAPITSRRCTVSTGVRAEGLIRSWAFINRSGGATRVQRCYGITRFAAGAKPRVFCNRPRSLTTSFQSRMAVSALSERTCRACACPVTTPRPPQRPRPRASDPVLRGRGDESLQTAAQDALACANFCACKLNKGGYPPKPAAKAVHQMNIKPSG
jgi:hypothetical protein